MTGRNGEIAAYQLTPNDLTRRNDKKRPRISARTLPDDPETWDDQAPRPPTIVVVALRLTAQQRSFDSLQVGRSLP